MGVSITDRPKIAWLVLPARFPAALGYALAALACAGCAWDGAHYVDDKATSLGSLDAWELQQAGHMLIVDVRPSTMSRGRMPVLSYSVPLTYANELQVEHFVASIQHIREARREFVRIGLICERGILSARALKALHRAGQVEVEQVAGGVSGNESDPGWHAWGLPLR